MIRVSYQSNAVALAAELGAIAARGKDVRPVLEDLGERMVNYSIPQNFREGGRPDRWPGSKRGGQTMVDTARLLRSVTHAVAGGTLRVGTNVRYAAQRHFGGTLVPKDAKYLAVPLDGAARRRPRQFDNLKWAPPTAKSGPNVGGFLVQRLTGRAAKRQKARYRYLFVLLKKVEQPARPFLLFQTDDIAYAERAMAKHLLQVAS
jgi:phage gpG-like protein